MGPFLPRLLAVRGTHSFSASKTGFHLGPYLSVRSQTGAHWSELSVIQGTAVS